MNPPPTGLPKLPRLWVDAQKAGITLAEWTAKLKEIGAMDVAVMDSHFQEMAEWIAARGAKLPKLAPLEDSVPFQNPSVAGCVVCKKLPTHLYSTRLGGPICNTCYQAKLAEWGAPNEPT